MKVNKLLTISLLAGSLLISGCNIFGPVNKGYQGESGATELDEEKWNLAFSLEEHALRRNCKLVVTRNNTKITTLFDYGKIKEDNYEHDIDNMFYKFNKVSNGKVSGTFYQYDYDGHLLSMKDEEQLDATMSQFGLIAYKYSDFTYKADSKSYYSSGFKYEVKVNDKAFLSFDCSDVNISIVDGYPSDIRFNYTQPSTEQVFTYHAEYSDYNKTKVNIPTKNIEPPEDRPTSYSIDIPDGTLVSFDEFKTLNKNRPTATYTHVDVTYKKESLFGKEEAYTTFNLQEGQWYEKQRNDFGFEIINYIFDEDYVAGYNNMVNRKEVEFYQNEPAKEYALAIRYQFEGKDIAANVILDEYFYVIKEEIANPDYKIETTLIWS